MLLLVAVEGPVEGRGFIEYGVHVSDRRHIPRVDVLVASRGGTEHVLHVGDRHHVPCADSVIEQAEASSNIQPPAHEGSRRYVPRGDRCPG